MQGHKCPTPACAAGAHGQYRHLLSFKNHWSHVLADAHRARQPERCLDMQRCRRAAAKQSACQATSTDDAVAETDVITADGQEVWAPSLEKVRGLGFEDEEAEKIVRKAFGWAGQAYWRKSKVKESPNAEQVQAVIDFLTERLKLKENDVKKAVKLFPEVLGLPVEGQLQANVEKLKKDWKMTDKVIPNVVKRQPQVLGYNYDCEGNCAGECNRCWVRF